MTRRSPDGRTEVDVDAAFGGRIVSLRRDGVELLSTAPDGDPMLTGCYPMAPWAGRIRDATFVWEGSRVQLPVAAPPHAIHGTVHDVAWSGSDGSEELHVDLDGRWPFGGRAVQTIDVTDHEVVCRLTVVAVDQSMPVVLGYHPCFSRRLSNGAELSLDVRPGWMWRRDGDGIPTGERVDPPSGPWDDAFGGLAAPPRLTWSGGPTLDLFSTHDVWVVYDERDEVVCVEPQTAPPDALNASGEASADVVPPGGSLSLELRLRWVGSTPC